MYRIVDLGYSCSSKQNAYILGTALLFAGRQIKARNDGIGTADQTFYIHDRTHEWAALDKVLDLGFVTTLTIGHGHFSLWIKLL